MTNRRLFIAFIAILLAGVVLCVAYDASAEDCTGPQCCACEPSQAAEPAPLPHLYLPSVMQRMPAMAAEFTPAQPMQTPEPDIELPLGDASQ